MAREATNLEIATLRTEGAPGVLTTRTGAETAVPELFTAYISLLRPPLDLTMTVRVPRGGVAQIRRLEVDPGQGEPTITSGALRGVALDKLLREALKDAEVVVIPLREKHPDAYTLEGDAPETFRLSRPAQSRAERRKYDLAAQAAEVYLKAVEEGSRAPAEAVAAALDRSRSQAAVYIRLAREEGWIPPRDGEAPPAKAHISGNMIIGPREAILSEENRAKGDEEDAKLMQAGDKMGGEADVDRSDQDEDQA